MPCESLGGDVGNEGGEAAIHAFLVQGVVLLHAHEGALHPSETEPTLVPRSEGRVVDDIVVLDGAVEAANLVGVAHDTYLGLLKRGWSK